MNNGQLMLKFSNQKELDKMSDIPIPKIRNQAVKIKKPKLDVVT